MCLSSSGSEPREAAAVVLVNLGTPDDPSPRAVRRYLAGLLGDPRVVEMNRALWWTILHLFILPFRPRKSAAMYRRIWTEAGSPLLLHTARQSEELGRRLAEESGGQVKTVFGMVVGRPSIRDALAQVRASGARRIFILPLFPQYTAASTGAAFDYVFRQLSGMRVVPELRTCSSFHDHPGYIAALELQVRSFWERNNRGEKLVLSFHGLPRRCVEAGDPYAAQCCRTAQLLSERLELSADDYVICFQSRFGPAQWLKPYTEEILRELPCRGVKVADVLCPGFAADCLETLEEIAIRGADEFKKRGGAELRYIPALNDSPAFIEALLDISRKNLEGWLK